MELGRTHPSRKTGAEPLTASGTPVGPTLRDFWAWSMSDLVSNATRGVLAEFIVATSLGVDIGGVRNEWDAWDLTTPDGIKVEVKSAAYLQSWNQRELSKITFSTRASLAWDADSNRQAATPTRHADVYVFALLHHTDKTTVDPLNLDQWTFFVVPTSVLDARTRSQHSITLPSFSALSPPATPIGFGEVRAAVEAAAHPHP